MLTSNPHVLVVLMLFSPDPTFLNIFSWCTESLAPELNLEINLHCANTLFCMNLEPLANTSYQWGILSSLLLLLFWIIIPQKTNVSDVFIIVKKLIFFLFTVITLKPFLKIILLTKIDLHLCVCELFWWELSDLTCILYVNWFQLIALNLKEI